MYTILVVLHVLVSIALIGLVLMQHGKGADAGAAFGSGASGTVFGARGSANFLTRVTAWLAAAFFILSLALAYIVHGRSNSESVVDGLAAPAAEAIVPAQVELPAAGAPAVESAPAATVGEPAPQVPDAPVAESAPATEENAPKPQVPQ
ncbi:preprotein translocase subunit SecG [Nevskia sp.]|uniref:preprotein translocase subunit SecG n=1 Tax=Nevskia sp. TaxID=1929292 RepID=UPI0025EB1C75|nr:preprotein translocase subunit SecG [Nevskia sp.]